MAVNNDVPVLRKEELIIILKALFKFSQEPNNAFQRKEDGLFVLDFHQLFQDHITDTSIHATEEETKVLRNFSIIDDILCYKGEPIVIKVSKDEGNAVEVREDGIYLKDITSEISEHMSNDAIHVTQQDKDNWNQILQTANEYAVALINALLIYNFQMVSELPVDVSTIKENTIYCLEKIITDTNEKYYARYIYRNGWITFDPIASLNSFLTKTDANNTYITKDDAETILKITQDEETGALLFNGKSFLDQVQISEDEDNGLFFGSDNKLFVKDLSQELASIARQASLSKVTILDQECDQGGIYELEEDIENFNFISIHYYLKSDNPDVAPYDAKSEMLDTDILAELREKHIDYILEHDYGTSTYNTKIRFLTEGRLQVTYYNHVCIYKIIGVR